MIDIEVFCSSWLAANTGSIIANLTIRMEITPTKRLNTPMSSATSNYGEAKASSLIYLN